MRSIHNILDEVHCIEKSTRHKGKRVDAHQDLFCSLCFAGTIRQQKRLVSCVHTNWYSYGANQYFLVNVASICLLPKSRVFYLFTQAETQMLSDKSSFLWSWSISTSNNQVNLFNSIVSFLIYDNTCTYYRFLCTQITAVYWNRWGYPFSNKLKIFDQDNL